MLSKLREDQCREGQAVDPQVGHWGGCEVIGLVGGLEVGRGEAVRWKVMTTASPTSRNHRDDPSLSVHGFFGFALFRLWGLGAFLRLSQATTPAIILFLFCHLDHLLSVSSIIICL